MTALDKQKSLIDVRGNLAYDVPLAAQTWFRVGGTADCIFKPVDIDDLCHFLKQIDPAEPVMPLGVASNLIIRDGGIRGTVIRLLKDFTKIEVLDHHRIKVGAGAPDRNLAMVAAKNGIGGLEFFSGIPGTIGGALRMNAGCYGRETKDVLVEATCVDRTGTLHTVTPKDLNMQYRHTDLDPSWIVVEAIFQGTERPDADIQKDMDDIKERRESSQPIREKTGGSTFANPKPHSSWALIDKAGLRGFTFGGAQVSEKHCNFLINTGDATAYDLEQLGEIVRKRVFENSGIMLRWEIKRIGDLREGVTIDYAE